ncbi:MAG: 16S rRNA (adenine(1518)-N(6)/adenine(1519)-N(6))-dimethyltransferase RsmA [Spirochaetota bacterium]
MTKKDVSDILANLNCAPNKKLGQNFLVQKEYAEKIVNGADIRENDRVLEIGPGLGALTEIMAERGVSLTCVEIDAGYYRYLSKQFHDYKNLSFIHSDFLRMDEYRHYDRVISNLPYYCASELLFTIAEKIMPSRICAMMQKEMAQRITAKPGTPQYGAMTVSLSCYYQPEHLFNVPPSAFFPQPDVVSSVLSFTRVNRTGFSVKEAALFHLLVKSAFWGRRKTIIKALSSAPHLAISKNIIESALEESSIPCGIRGEELSLESFITLAKNLYAKAGNDGISL